MVAEWHACENRFGSSDGIGHHKARGGVESESSLVGGITASGNLSDLVQEGGGLFSHAAPSLVSKSSKRVGQSCEQELPTSRNIANFGFLRGDTPRLLLLLENLIVKC